jgi:hypothetical protein
MCFPAHDFRARWLETQQQTVQTTAARRTRSRRDYFLKLSSFAMKALGPPFT